MRADETRRQLRPRVGEVLDSKVVAWEPGGNSTVPLPKRKPARKFYSRQLVGQLHIMLTLDTDIFSC